MKRLKQGLGIAALVAGMSGCSGYNSSYGDPVVAELPPVKNLSTDEIEPRADEKYVVNTDFGYYCPQADVHMYAGGYFINCNANSPINKSIIHNGNFNTDTLDWEKVAYIDDDSDGVLDRIYVNRFEIRDIGQEQKDWYNKTVQRLNKDLVHHIWLERWHPDLLQ